MAPAMEHDVTRETTGERLVRIETLLTGMKEALTAHIADEEKELADTRRMIADHINASGTLGVDVHQIKRDMHDVQGRMKSLEHEVQQLVKNKTVIVAWASGAGSVITLLSSGFIWLVSKLIV